MAIDSNASIDIDTTNINKRHNIICGAIEIELVFPVNTNSIQLARILNCP